MLGCQEVAAGLPVRRAITGDPPYPITQHSLTGSGLTTRHLTCHGLTDATAQSPNQIHHKRAIIEVNSIVSGRNNNILASIIAQFAIHYRSIRLVYLQGVPAQYEYPAN